MIIDLLKFFLANIYKYKIGFSTHTDFFYFYLSFLFFFKTKLLPYSFKPWYKNCDLFGLVYFFNKVVKIYG